jgi:hypothetical protein
MAESGMAAGRRVVFLGTPRWADWEQELFSKSMRKAAFPVCATDNELKAFPNLTRLPECVGEQAMK